LSKKTSYSFFSPKNELNRPEPEMEARIFNHIKCLTKFFLFRLLAGVLAFSGPEPAVAVEALDV
jgi:hypothetical protein